LDLRRIVPVVSHRIEVGPNELEQALAAGYDDIRLRPGIYTKPLRLRQDVHLRATSPGVVFAPVVETEWIRAGGMKLPASPDVAAILVVDGQGERFDGPESDLAVEASANALTLAHSDAMIQVQNGATVFLEGITVYGGIHNLRAEGAKTRVIAQDCRFGYPIRHFRVRNQSAIALEGASAIFLRCEVFGAPEDGIDARSSEYLIEIDVHAHRNGRTGTRNNGSTMHAGGRAIRIGGTYESNRGPNLGDHGAGTQSLNIGVKVFGSVAPESRFRKGISAFAGAQVWLSQSPEAQSALKVTE